MLFRVQKKAVYSNYVFYLPDSHLGCHPSWMSSDKKNNMKTKCIQKTLNIFLKSIYSPKRNKIETAVLSMLEDILAVLSILEDILDAIRQTWNDRYMKWLDIHYAQHLF